MMASESMLASAVLALLIVAAPVGHVLADDAEEAIRATLHQWTKDFNAGNADAVCKLFSPDLRYDFSRLP